MSADVESDHYWDDAQLLIADFALVRMLGHNPEKQFTEKVQSVILIIASCAAYLSVNSVKHRL